MAAKAEKPIMPAKAEKPRHAGEGRHPRLSSFFATKNLVFSQFQCFFIAKKRVS
jgi:hypothetical protein